VLSPLGTLANACPRVARADARATRRRATLVVVPRAELRAPVLYLAVVRLGPLARVDAWICGAAAACAGFDLGLRGAAPPSWIAPLTARGSARTLVVRPSRLAARALGTYLEALERAHREPDPRAARASQQTVLDVLRAHARAYSLPIYSG
jgi:hypothetical protein